MNPTNKVYLERMKRRFSHTDSFGKSDLEFVRVHNRRLGYTLPAFIALFLVNFYRLIDQAFASKHPGNFDLGIPITLSLILCGLCIWLIFQYRRSESCRSELEDQLMAIQEQNQHTAKTTN